MNIWRAGYPNSDLIITATFDTTIRARCEAAGVTAFLSKPSQTVSLCAAIDDEENCGGAALSVGSHLRGGRNERGVLVFPPPRFHAAKPCAESYASTQD